MDCCPAIAVIESCDSCETLSSDCFESTRSAPYVASKSATGRSDVALVALSLFFSDTEFLERPSWNDYPSIASPVHDYHVSSRSVLGVFLI